MWMCKVSVCQVSCVLHILSAVPCYALSGCSIHQESFAQKTLLVSGQPSQVGACWGLIVCGERLYAVCVWMCVVCVVILTGVESQASSHKLVTHYHATLVVLCTTHA